MIVLIAPAMTLVGVWIGALIYHGIQDRRLMRAILATLPEPIVNFDPPTVAELNAPEWLVASQVTDGLQ